MPKDIDYKVSIKHNGETKCYFGSTAKNWETQYCQHKISLTNIQYSNNTALSKFVCGIKMYKYISLLNWNYIPKAKPFSGKRDKCNLCLWKKTQPVEQRK